jgi:Porin subfamily
MAHRIALPRVVAAVAVTLALTVPTVSSAVAQTLTNPNPQPRPSPPSDGKLASAKHQKACTSYGAGFIQIPGSDACIEVGGYVTIDSGGGRR